MTPVGSRSSFIRWSGLLVIVAGHLSGAGAFLSSPSLPKPLVSLPSCGLSSLSPSDCPSWQRRSALKTPSKWVNPRPLRKTTLAGSTVKEPETESALIEAHPYKDALTKTGFAVAAALAFGLVVTYMKGIDAGLEYYAGYVVEQSLSVDNLFVFLVLFNYFKVPNQYQSRVLTWGIVGSMIMRGLMVVAGVEALEHFKPILLVFAAILVGSSFKLLFENGDGDGEDEDLNDNAIISFAKGLVKSVDHYDGENFFTIVDGARYATPLLVVLICIELSDVVFAVDSVPAVFGVTKDPFIVYTSNIFAILGLRSLYAVLSNAMLDLPYLKPSVALILGLVGGKLGAEYFGYEISTSLSLGVICSLLGLGVGASLLFNNKNEGDSKS